MAVDVEDAGRIGRAAMRQSCLASVSAFLSVPLIAYWWFGGLWVSILVLYAAAAWLTGFVAALLGRHSDDGTVALLQAVGVVVLDLVLWAFAAWLFRRM